MPNKPRKKPGGKGARQDYERRFGVPYSPTRVIGSERCGDLHPAEYVAGIDFYCDGEASKRGADGWRHRREVVARYRHSTCEKSADYDERRPWTLPIAIERVPIPGTPMHEVREYLPRDHGGPDGRQRLDCSRCTFERVLTPETVDKLMSEVWAEHAQNVDRRNVSTLLVS